MKSKRHPGFLNHDDINEKEIDLKHNFHIRLFPKTTNALNT